MSVVTVTEAVPVRIEGVFEFLRGRNMTDEELRAAVSPPSLLRSEPTMIERVLAACRDLKLLEQTDGTWRVAQDVSTRDGLRDYLEKALLGTTGADTKQQHVAKAMAWFLTLDPARPPQVSDTLPVEIAKECGGEDFDLSNLGRLQQFAYWAVYLGFAWRLNVSGGPQGLDYLEPDPTAALERHLHGVLQPGERVAIGEAIGRVASRCPVFEGGELRIEMDAILAHVRPRESHELSRATSFALRRLQQRDVVGLESASDAATYTLTSPERRSYTHLTLKARG